MLNHEIVDELKREFPRALSNSALAIRLQAPEPSIRRATRKLRDRGIIVADYPSAAFATNQGVRYSAATA